MKRKFVISIGALLGVAVAAAAIPASAGVTVYEDGDKYAEIGGRLQVQYKRVDPDAGESVDDLFFRRLRFYIEGGVTRDISGKWQVDFGKEGEDPAVKDAFMVYSGLPVGDIKIGNQTAPFSREQLTSSKTQQTVERQFAGDHNFGVVDRQMGISLKNKTGTLAWHAGLYQGGIDPSLSAVDFTSRVSEDAEYFGNMIVGRIDFNPLGHFKMAQGAFGEDLKFGVGVNAYTWSNDEDVDFVDVADQYEDITGFGIDGALRVGYFSADAAYQRYSAELDSTSASFGTATGLVDADGDADFDTYLVKGGYMFRPNGIEGVLAYSVLDADAWAEKDTRISVGANFFINKHKDKIVVTYENGRDVGGADGNDVNTLYIQFQHLL
jgi:hypothetical protein